MTVLLWCKLLLGAWNAAGLGMLKREHSKVTTSQDDGFAGELGMHFVDGECAGEQNR
jgi:hypothetical protein